MILLITSCIAGVLTVLAPCTLSLLPVIVGGTLSGGSSLRRIITVTASLGVSVIAFTLLLKVSSVFVNVPQGVWQGISGAVIILLGFTMLFPRLWDTLPVLGALNRGSNRIIAQGYGKQDLFGDVLTGAALGPVFSSCSPTYFLILATVLPVSIATGFGYLLVYTLGLCGTLFCVALLGQRLVERLGVAADPQGWIKRGVDILFILIGASILTGFMQRVELAATSIWPDETTIERALLAGHNTPSVPADHVATSTEQNLPEDQPMNSTPPLAVADAAMRIAKKAAVYPRAPEITNPSGFINTGMTADGSPMPITIGQFKGKKVVLVDFWTYSCINCQRTLPYVKAWYDKYKDQGLEIISIHTPEFAFEKVLGNVQAAVDGFGIKYPVVLDNEYGTWGAFANSYWPRKYLVDIDGFVVYDHAGEGDYDVTEAAIQKALTEREQVLGMQQSVPEGMVAPADAVTSVQAHSPETYFGASRNEYLANGVPGMQGRQVLVIPSSIELNHLYLGGTWDFSPEYARANAGATITYRYAAKGVYFVAASNTGATLSITVDGKPVPATMAGIDVHDGGATIQANRLYKIIDDSSAAVHTLEIKVERGTLDAYTFTFG